MKKKININADRMVKNVMFYLSERERQHITFSDLAKRANVGRSTIAEMQKQRSMCISTLKKYAKSWKIAYPLLIQLSKPQMGINLNEPLFQRH